MKNVEVVLSVERRHQENIPAKGSGLATNCKARTGLYCLEEMGRNPGQDARWAAGKDSGRRPGQLPEELEI